MHFKLTEEILKLSNSDLWDNAKLEWNFEFAYYSDSPQNCLCGHYPINNICVIKNSENNNETEIGNCCVKKFLKIEDGDKIFSTIKRLKSDKTKSMSLEVLEYLRKKKVLTDFDYNFYSDTIRKRKLSEKQLAIRIRINQKLIDFTSYETNSHITRINLVLKWAEDNPWFDNTFLNSLKSNCETKGSLTEKQSLALENIISKFQIV